MVKNITALSSTGLRDWLIQRVSAVILACYTIFLVIYFLIHPNLNYQTWHALYANWWMKTATVITLLSLLFHAWIGIWTVLTDYIKCAIGRGTLQVLVIIALIGFFIWGLEVIY